MQARNVHFLSRLLLVGVCLSAAGSALAGPPLLWSVTGKGGATSYLFGTIHVPDESLQRLDARVASALDGCQVFVSEVPLDLNAQMSMAMRTMLSGGKSLSDVLPDGLYRQVSELFQSKGIPAMVVDRLKVWAVAVQLVLVDHLLEMASKPPLDQMLYKKAQAAGKRLDALEKIAEQVDIFDSLKTAEQVQLLRSALEYYRKKKKQGKDPVAELVAVYRSGDAAAIRRKVMEEYDQSDPLEKRLLDKIFFERNRRLAERIAERLRQHGDQVWFFAVGAGHLPGKDGIVERLRRSGFTVTRVK
ncbi:MAG: hypothetical protein DRI34_00045 [Deltaproteobacteria bacterium]|nr:MAG: hypothetical protein DRI34_00045 [Deltaproteobacteria bacterium]